MDTGSHKLLHDNTKNLIVHYKNSQFIHELPIDSDTWDNHTFLHLIDVIKERCNLRETFNIFEKMLNEQLIIDDIDDILAMFDNEESDINENDGTLYAKTPHIYVKDYNAMERENWNLNCYLLIYSRSKQQWFRGQITRIEGELNNEWFMVKYNYKFTKEIQRNSKDLKAIPSDSVYSLRTHSKCLVLSDYANIWHIGHILSILIEDGEEWLAIKYTENEIDKIVEIQRNSADLKVFNDENYKQFIMSQQYEKKQTDKKEEEIAPNSLESRINALHKNRNETLDNEIMDLLRIFSNILKSPFDSKFHRLIVDEVKYKWMTNPICVELLIDAGFKKTTNGKKLKFNINNMKQLKKTDKALKERFKDLADALVEEEEEAKIHNAEEYDESTVNSQLEALESLIYGSWPDFEQGKGIVVDTRSGGWQNMSLFGI